MSAPDGATQEQALEYAKEQFAKMPKTKPDDEPSKLNPAVDYNPGVGMVESTLALGSGMAGAVAGGLSGLGTIATNAVGLTNKPPGDVVRDVSAAVTYEPRSKAGQVITDVAAYPFEKLAQGADFVGGKVTDATGSPAVGAATNTAIQAAPMLLGRGAKAIPGESSASVAARAKAQSLNAKTDAGIAAARQEGLTITPTQAEAGILARTAESLSGSPRLEKAASRQNTSVINEMIRRDIGLPEDVPASRAELAKIRAEEGRHYEAIKKTGRFGTDAKYQADLYKQMQSVDTAAKDFAHRKENPLKSTYEGLKIESMDAASAIEEVKNLRQDADAAFARGEKQLGKAYKGFAQALDDQIDRHLQRHAGAVSEPAMAEAVAKYRGARERIAKTYAAEKALNDASGNFDPNVYAREQKKGKYLTGEAKKVADFASQFPKSAQYAERIGPTGATVFDAAPLVFGDIPMTVKGLLTGARPAARSIMLSDMAQDSLTAPRTYGPSRMRSLQDLLEEATAAQGAAATAIGQRGRP